MAALLLALILREEEIEEDNRALMRRRMRDMNDPFTMSAEDFLTLFRLPQEGVMYLTQVLTAELGQRERITGIPTHLRILCALNFFASGINQGKVGQDFWHAMSQSEVSKSIRRVSDAINQRLLSAWIKFPGAAMEKQRIKGRFMEETGFPGILGAVDCTHIAIVPPDRAREHIYLNRKNFHSKNVQIICDYDLRIIGINARFGGRSHDSHIWKSSNLSTHMEQSYCGGDRSSWLLGDSGYPLQPWLLTPFSDPAPDTPEARYNASHCKAHSCVERCIGVLKARFRCLRKERALHYAPERAGIIINACAVLHNIASHYRVPHPEELPMEEIDNVQVNKHNPLRDGLAVRRRVVAQNFA